MRLKRFITESTGKDRYDKYFDSGQFTDLTINKTCFFVDKDLNVLDISVK